jgi:hypothetical protein
VVDVSNAAQPVVVGQDTGCPYAQGVDVSVDGDTTYIACASDATFANALRIVDTSNRAQPLLLGSLTLPGLPPNLTDYNVAYSVVVAGTRAYVGNEFGVDEIDVSDPTAPVWLARQATGYTVRKVERAPDGRIFAFASAAGVFVYAPPGDAIFADGFD